MVPVDPASIAGAILASAPFPQGPTYSLVATAVGTAMTTWILGNPLNFQLSGITTGTAGNGLVSGKLTFPPSPSIVASSLAAAGCSGPTTPLLAQGVSLGVATALTSTALYTGQSIGVGAGSDISTVLLSNPATLTSLLLSNFSATFTSAGGLPTGIAIISLSQGLGVGLASQCQLATGVGTVTGSPAPTSASGTSLSVVV